jgi:putative transposase
MTNFIEAHRGRFGVERICRVMESNVSTYYAHQGRPPSRRAIEDAWLTERIKVIYEANYSVYGVRKVWHAVGREGVEVGRDRVARLMRAEGLRGVRRGKRVRTTIPAEQTTGRPADLVQRAFGATRPNELWVADLTYVVTWSGLCYVAFVIDVFSRVFVGWSLATHLRTELPLEALEMAIWRRDTDLAGLVHHSDRGTQYTSIRYTDRLVQAGIDPSVGSAGDSYDNALAESQIGLYKTELIGPRRPWRNPEEVEIETLEWVDWFNNRRLHSEIGYVPPAEFEAAYYAALEPVGIH